MRVIIAPDKFKGSLSAKEVVAHLTAGLRSFKTATGEELEVDGIPVADGGEGTLEAAFECGFARRTAIVSGPTGAALRASYAIRGREAVIEMAQASGLAVLPAGVKDAGRASSRGTGELIKAALDAGCSQITLGVGGSASTDGGAGVLQGLGARFLDADENELPGGGVALARLARIDLTALDPRLKKTHFVLASDVENPLLGSDGSAAVFGPQKGAMTSDVKVLDAALARFVEVLGHRIGPRALEAAHAPGAGAAGGVGYAALAVLAAERRPGIDVVLEFTGMAKRLSGADLVITGEGSLDEQSLLGKTPVGVARATANAGVPVIAVCGRTTLNADQLRAAGFLFTYALNEIESNVEICMAEAGPLLEEVGAAIAAQFGSSTFPGRLGSRLCTERTT